MNMLIEMTLPELLASTERAFPDSNARQNLSDDITIESNTVTRTNDGLLVKSVVMNVNKQTRNECSVLLENIDYTNEADPESIKITSTDGSVINIKPIDVNNCNVKVSCSCMDFKFRFALINHSKGALLGQKPESYNRKTDNRPPANPTSRPGVCKHLTKVLEDLQSNSLF